MRALISRLPHQTRRMGWSRAHLASMARHVRRNTRRVEVGRRFYITLPLVTYNTNLLLALRSRGRAVVDRM
jgi:hypothetical protein